MQFGEGCESALGDLREVISKLLFLDDEKVFGVCFDQPQVPKALHKFANSWPRRAHHLRQFFV